MLYNSEVNIVSVPKLEEFSAKNLMRQALHDHEIRKYLPELSDYDHKSESGGATYKGRAFNRQYLHNVSGAPC